MCVRGLAEPDGRASGLLSNSEAATVAPVVAAEGYPLVSFIYLHLLSIGLKAVPQVQWGEIGDSRLRYPEIGK